MKMKKMKKVFIFFSPFAAAAAVDTVEATEAHLHLLFVHKDKICLKNGEGGSLPPQCVIVNFLLPLCQFI